MKVFFVRCALILAIFTSLDALGQVATGTPPFGSFGGGPFDTVDLANLNVHFSIPILSKPGRGLPFHYLMDYESSFWVPTGSGGSMLQPTNTGNWGWRAQSEALTGSMEPQTASIHINGVISPFWGLSRKVTVPGLSRR